MKKQNTKGRSNIRNFFSKPYRFAIVFGTLLTLCLLWSLAVVFIVPVEIDVVPEEHTGELFELATKADINEQTENTEENTEENTWGVGILGEDNTSKALEEAETTVREETTAAPDYPVIEDNFYQDENIRIEITETRSYDTTVYIADVRISSLAYLKTAMARDKFGNKITELTSSMAERNNAIFAVNGDYYGANTTGYVIKNSKIYRKSKRGDTSYADLAILNTGRFFVFSEDDYTANDILEMGAYQGFAFGPALINEGKIIADDTNEVKVHSAQGNPRCAIGYIDDLHYLFVVSDGRSKESPGLSISKLAEFMYEHGCTYAYNLDGGGSATMWFNGRIINKPTTDGKNIKERAVSDCVYIGY